MISDQLALRYEVPGPRYTSYPTVPTWRDDFGPGHYARKLGQAGRAGPSAPLSVYVHIPFCREMCSYCGCNVVITSDPRRADAYLDVVEREVELVAGHLGTRRRVSQLHWGGGTPTFLDLAQLTRLWSILASRFVVLPDAEVAIEIDPVVTTADQLALLRRLGFGRLSMGVQDLDPDVQQAVRRIQTVDETRAMLVEARRLGFAAVNFDLICGLPLQTPESWRRTLEQVIALRPDRLAVYSFAYVPEVRPHQRRLAVFDMPTGRAKLALLRLGGQMLEAAGYQRIGMDHFALPGDELAIAQRERRLRRNFQGYTVVPASDVIAFGATGISDVAGAFAQNLRPLPAYTARIARGELATTRGVELSPDDQRRRAVIESLLCNFFADLGPDAACYFERELGELQTLEREGIVSFDGRHVMVMPEARILVRNVAMVFDAYLHTPAQPAVFSSTL